MEEHELNIEELFRFMNAHEGEFFVRVMLNEEGEFCGEPNGCCDDKVDKRVFYHV